ncbi:MAG: hypothetical protein VB060_08190 [Oscillibacter sp.]|nr:hypothetical protein [Oscillibacter sp.]MEA4993796.1 hypothetical protein [Oscillibacter sp.]
MDESTIASTVAWGICTSGQFVVIGKLSGLAVKVWVVFAGAPHGMAAYRAFHLPVKDVPVRDVGRFRPQGGVGRLEISRRDENRVFVRYNHPFLFGLQQHPSTLTRRFDPVFSIDGLAGVSLVFQQTENRAGIPKALFRPLSATDSLHAVKQPFLQNPR